MHVLTNRGLFAEPQYLVLKQLLKGIPRIPLSAVASEHLRALDELGRPALFEEALAFHDAELGATAGNSTLLQLLLLWAALVCLLARHLLRELKLKLGNTPTLAPTELVSYRESLLSSISHDSFSFLTRHTFICYSNHSFSNTKKKKKIYTEVWNKHGKKPRVPALRGEKIKFGAQTRAWSTATYRPIDAAAVVSVEAWGNESFHFLTVKSTSAAFFPSFLHMIPSTFFSLLLFHPKMIMRVTFISMLDDPEERKTLRIDRVSLRTGQAVKML